MTQTKFSTMFGLACLALVLPVGCGGGGGGGGGGGVKSSISIEDASAACDPYADAFDDLFIFEAFTDGPVEEVSFCIEYGNYDYGCWVIPEQNAGYWYGELWADDLGSDCDEMGGMIFTVQAYGEDGSFDSIGLR